MIFLIAISYPSAPDIWWAIFFTIKSQYRTAIHMVPALKYFDNIILWSSLLLLNSQSVTKAFNFELHIHVHHPNINIVKIACLCFVLKKDWDTVNVSNDIIGAHRANFFYQLWVGQSLPTNCLLIGWWCHWKHLSFSIFFLLQNIETHHCHICWCWGGARDDVYEGEHFCHVNSKTRDKKPPATNGLLWFLQRTSWFAY